MPVAPRTPDTVIAETSLAHLQWVVGIDSQSDEASQTIPTTEGQRVLAEALAGFYTRLGARVEHDENANVLAWFPGRGPRADAAPVAFAVHLDTARGTVARPSLHVADAWDGTRVPYPANPTIQVDVAHYPALAGWVGQDLIHGEGDFPFGLDDKLGLTHLLTLATLLAAHPEVEHPPLVFVARPDEEVGRHEAVVGLARTLARAGVVRGYTVDGILPFEINVENFNGAGASLLFAPRPALPFTGERWEAHIGGVNTHGATACAEGHRGAPRLVTEWRAATSPADALFVGFVSDALRDCDARVIVRIAPGAEARVRAALSGVMGPHLPRGAAWSLVPAAHDPAPDDGAVEPMLTWLHRFYASDPGFTLPCEASEGRDGYSQPYRARPGPDGLRLDVRVRDFDPERLEARITHLADLAGEAHFTWVHQYVNMGPRLAEHPDLVRIALEAAADVGVVAPVAPIRGGTGVDPFLDEGIPIANLGTGYFAPESEKELTTRQLLAGHVRWLFALIQRL